MNVPTSFKQRAMLVDEIWHAVGDGASDIDWYVKRTILGGIYSTTEIYMLTDSSTGLCSLSCSQNSDLQLFFLPVNK
jgi:ubiquinone biosynthesis protein COQ9